MTLSEQLGQLEHLQAQQTEIIRQMRESIQVEPVTDITASLSGNVITVEWQSNSNSLLDIQYYANDHREWQHSVADYVGWVHSDEERYTISVGEHEGWKVRIVSGDWESEAVDVEVENTEPKPERKIPVGFWYPQNLPTGYKHFNCSKTWQVGQINDHLKDHEYCTLSISGMLKDNYEAVIKQIGKALQSVPADRVPFILLQDEPYLHGFSKAQLIDILRLCKEHFGEHTPAISYTIGDFQNKRMPDVPHLIVMNFYPFFDDPAYGEIYSKEEFDTYLDSLIDNALVVNSEFTFSITGQAFYSTPTGNHPWRKPPVESPEWYYDAIKRRSEIVHMSWWAYKLQSDKWKYLSDMPDLLKAVEEVNQRLM